jgi:hypothetical protein
MKYIIFVIILSLLFMGCLDKNDSDVEGEKKVEHLFNNLMTEEEWNSFFSTIVETGLEHTPFDMIIGRDTLLKPSYKIAEKFGFILNSGQSILDDEGFETIGGIDVFAFGDHVFIIYEVKKGRIDGKSIFEVKDFLFIPVTSSSFDFAEAKTDKMNNYNKERNVWGLFYWDSPLIQPDVEIPAEKVIIVDIETSKMTLEDNENGEYKVFIDAAFLE